MNNNTTHTIKTRDLTPADDFRLQQIKSNIDKFNFNLAKHETKTALNSSADPIVQALALKEAGAFKRIAQNVALKYHVESWLDDLEAQAFESWYYIQSENKYKNRTVFACTRSDVVKFVIRYIYGINERSLQLYGLPVMEDIDKHLNIAEQVIESRLPEVLEICKNPKEKTIAIMLAQGYKQREIAEDLKLSPNYVCQIIKSMAKRIRFSNRMENK